MHTIIIFEEKLKLQKIRTLICMKSIILCVHSIITNGW